MYVPVTLIISFYKTTINSMVPLVANNQYTLEYNIEYYTNMVLKENAKAQGMRTQ